MPDSSELLNAARIIPPFSGWCSLLYNSGAASSQDLSAIGPQQPIADPAGSSLDDILAPIQSNAPDFQGLLGRYVRFTAVTSTMWVIFGPTLASVTSGNAPVIPTGTSNILGSGTANGVPEPIFPGVQGIDLFVSVSCKFIGIIGSAAGFLVVRPSSRGDRG